MKAYAAPVEGTAACLTPPCPPGILVVDDDPAIRQMLNLALHHYGFEVWLAATGTEAVSLYRQHRDAIAAVLLDVRMPELDGPTTLLSLAEVNPEVRCVFMSGCTGSYRPEDLLRLGARDIISKPFDLANLADRLRQVIQD